MLNISIYAKSDKILVTGHTVDSTISIHAPNFKLNLPLEMAEALLVNLQDKVGLLKRFDEAEKGGE